MDGGGTPAFAAGTGAQGGLIGPNAVLQLLAPMRATLGEAEASRILALCGLDPLPDGSGMIPEGPVAALHQSLRRAHPATAEALARTSGAATADYIMANRIPALARVVLRALPRPLAVRLLARAIARNAWTFTGSGRFRILSLDPPVFEIADNPVVRGEHAMQPVCHWHAAVFTRLFQSLADRRLVFTETECCATGAGACRFSASAQLRA